MSATWTRWAAMHGVPRAYLSVHARIEGVAALSALFTRYDELRLTAPPTRRVEVTLHGYDRLRAAVRS